MAPNAILHLSLGKRNLLVFFYHEKLSDHWQSINLPKLINTTKIIVFCSIFSSPQSTPDSIYIKWSDNHESHFKHDWLDDRNFTTERQAQYLHEHYRPNEILWPKHDFSSILKTFQFQDIMENDSILRDWLQNIAVYGVTIIENTPDNKNQARRLCDRIGFIKKTHFGEEFAVTHRADASNRAYLSAHLQQHTDLPYYEYTPGVIFLHCLVQAKGKGGENLLTDGFYVAEKMRLEYPEMFEILTKTLVNWNDVGEENGNHFHSIYRAPVISLLNDGQIEQIKYSVPQRDSFFSVSVETVQAWYEAHAIFVRLILEESVEFKTKAGDILVFNNLRMVHGRTGYTDQADNSRYLVGAYVDWDELYSTLRVLQKSLKEKN